MIIKSIILNNYRLYKGINRIDFFPKKDKNIFLISGENGFGKTTFLHSLIWCLYGRQIMEIETDVRRDFSYNGYNAFLRSNINNEVKASFDSFDSNTIREIRKRGYTPENEHLKSITQYYVSIDFGEVIIPSLPCGSIKITRTYDLALEKENVEILIDNAKNELTNEIGPDVFINDFILNNDIARFFFFDSEQIVTLAETTSMAEKKGLCSAYNEVLGVRKYEELKKNLENIRLRFRKKSADTKSRDELNTLIQNSEDLAIQIELNKERIQKIEGEIKQLRQQDQGIQLELMREGNNATTTEIKRIEVAIENAKKKDVEYKKQLKLFLEYAPIAISGHLLISTKEQILYDHNKRETYNNQQSQNLIVSDMTSDLLSMLKQINMSAKVSTQIQTVIQNVVNKYKCAIPDDDTLIVLSDQDYEEFMAVYNNITSTYKIEFERLAEDYKKNKLILDRNIRRLSVINSKEKDELIKVLRSRKNAIEDAILEKEQELRISHEKHGTLSLNLAKTNKRVSELSKKVSLDDSDARKDKIAETLINEISDFLVSLKIDKKYSLERRIKSILNDLMHKVDFIGNVEVLINDEDMDIELYAIDGTRINKDSLSKGEQQLYATSILKALVDESGIQFPVFIDSPLQKFDKSHATKIITEFYPQISKQVVLFPLLYKELTPKEYSVMKPLVNATYLIKNDNLHSHFYEVPVDDFLKEQ